MLTPRDRLRAAAAAFADSIHAILRADLSAELRAERHAPGESPSVQRPAPDGATSWIAKAAPELVDWVRQHPRATPRDLEAGLGWKRSKLFLVLGHATSAGALIKHGASRNVTYDVPGAPTAAMDGLPPAGAARNVIDRVVAIVRDRGRVRPKDFDVGISKTSLYRALARACDEGLLQKVGAPAAVEYVPFGASSPVARLAPVAGGGAAVQRAEQVVAYVRDNPGAPLVPLAEALDVSMASVFRAVTEAVAAGAIEKIGKGRYAVVGATPPPRPRRTRDDALAMTAPERSSLAGVALVDAVIAFVRTNPECRYKQLAAATGATERALHVALRVARERGAVRVEGAKIKTRYFPAS